MSRHHRRQDQRTVTQVVERKAGVPPTVGRVKLVLSEGLFLSHSGLTQKPSRWCRFWQRVLLGWRWEDV